MKTNQLAGAMLAMVVFNAADAAEVKVLSAGALEPGMKAAAAEFQKAGVRDKQKRSLRDLDLKTSLFRYPCSYLIYSDEFNALPPLAMNYVYQRLWSVLDGIDRAYPE